MQEEKNKIEILEVVKMVFLLFQVMAAAISCSH
jgi:hypothetical protein